MSEDLEEARVDDINNNSFILSGGLASFLRHEIPELVQVDSGLVLLVALEMEVTLTRFTEVTGMVFLEVDSVVVHATGVTATRGMLSVATDATSTHGDITSHLSRFSQSSNHFSLLMI